jgi:hypothetical protein
MDIAEIVWHSMCRVQRQKRDDAKKFGKDLQLESRVVEPNRSRARDPRLAQSGKDAKTIDVCPRIQGTPFYPTAVLV